jgi:hypothetical protein
MKRQICSWITIICQVLARSLVSIIRIHLKSTITLITALKRLHISQLIFDTLSSGKNTHTIFFSAKTETLRSNRKFAFHNLHPMTRKKNIFYYNPSAIKFDIHEHVALLLSRTVSNYNIAVTLIRALTLPISTPCTISYRYLPSASPSFNKDRWPAKPTAALPVAGSSTPSPIILLT